MDIEPPESTDFNVIKEDFKKHQAYGMLAAAIHLAQNCRTGRVNEKMSCIQCPFFLKFGILGKIRKPFYIKYLNKK